MPVDAALIQKCADPSLPPAIIERFIKDAGSADPLTVTVRSGNRIVLVPPAKTPEQALEIARSHVGHAVVRVGITQYPAGVGIEDPSELSLDLFDACKNLRSGTALFGKVWRIVWKWYGNPTDESVMPQMLDDAFDAWKRGHFEGSAVFTAKDPGESKAIDPIPEVPAEMASDEPGQLTPAPSLEKPAADPNTSGIRIDLSGIGGRTP